MTKLLLSLLLVSINILFTKAQEVQSLNSIKLGTDGPYYIYEQKISGQMTLNLGIGGGIGFTAEKVFITPAFLTEPRFYYNIKKRHQAGKFNNNSADFLCLTSGLYFGSIFYKNKEISAFIIPGWGLRRSLSNHFMFEMMLGSGILLDNKNVSFLPGINFRLGYIF